MEKQEQSLHGENQKQSLQGKWEGGSEQISVVTEEKWSRGYIKHFYIRKSVVHFLPNCLNCLSCSFQTCEMGITPTLKGCQNPMSNICKWFSLVLGK